MDFSTASEVLSTKFLALTTKDFFINFQYSTSQKFSLSLPIDERKVSPPKVSYYAVFPICSKLADMLPPPPNPLLIMSI